MKKSPSNTKLKNLGDKINTAQATYLKSCIKMEKEIQPYVLDCIRRKDNEGISILIDKMPKGFTIGTFYLYQALEQINQAKKKRKNKPK